MAQCEARELYHGAPGVETRIKTMFSMKQLPFGIFKIQINKLFVRLLDCIYNC